MNVARMWTGLVAAGVLAFGLSVQAQQPAGEDAAGAQAPSAPQSQAPAPDSAAPAAGTVTVEGCVKGAEGDAAAAGSFTLANAKAPEGADAAGVEIEDEYALSAPADVNLSQHVDHQVRVTGTVGAAAGDADAPTLNVTELEMVAASCAE
jgi:hypothetical protein